MFKSARLKLTAWYLLIIMVVSIFFSLVIYRGLTGEINRVEKLEKFRMGRRHSEVRLPSPIFLDPDFINEIKRRIIFGLTIVNGVIFFGAGALGYFLAGKTLRPIQEMVEEQNRFISDASHELRTPLTALKSSLEVNLRDKNLTIGAARKTIQENLDDVNSLQRLSDSLLQLSQYEKPPTYSQMEKVSLKQIIKEAVQKISPLAKNKNIKIFNKTLDIDLKANKFALIDLFIILLDNAVKYSEVKSMINVNTKKTDHSVLISVKDRGIGIDERGLPHIFDRFYRSDKARSKKETNGYGLGLSIAKKIVEQHRGSINVESKLKKGTTVIVRLPIFS